MNRKCLRYECLALCAIFVLLLVTGCGKPAEPQPDASPSPSAIAETTSAPKTESLTSQQKNAINMLNTLRALAQEISASANSRLYLEECYSTLLNNTHPNAVDPATLNEVMSLLDTLEKCRMIAVKREKLQYIYEQKKAQAIRAAMPDMTSLTASATNAISKQIPDPLLTMAVTIAFTAVDSVNSYQSASAEADLKYLMGGWYLDDEEAKALHNSRKQLFSYMVNMVNAFNLDGSLALSEDRIDEFVSWKNNANVVRRIQFLESSEDIYLAFGPYWLTLAESYYENGDYDKCLNAVGSYESLDMQIFRTDYDYAKILPLAIVSAKNTLDEAGYVCYAESRCQKIIANTGSDDWTLRYFTAQIYLDLWSITNDASYLEKAYDITLNNVNHLVDEQRALNSAYLTDVKEEKAPKGESKSAKEEREQYNRMLKEARKTELPPISEPLLLNCELLFSLARHLNVPKSELSKIERILHTNGEALFLSEPIDRPFWFNDSFASADPDSIEVSFNGTEFTIPAKYVSSDAIISVNVAGDTGTVTYNAWNLVRVDRKTKNDLDTFFATYKCSEARYSGSEKVTVTVTPKAGTETEIYTFTYMTEKPKYLGIEVDFLPDMQFHRER